MDTVRYLPVRAWAALVLLAVLATAGAVPAQQAAPTPSPSSPKPVEEARLTGTQTSEAVAAVRTASGLDGDHPADWGIACTSPDYTDVWRDEGGSAYVVEQILDGFASAGATARITGVHGSVEARIELVTTLQDFIGEHPECAAELKRFAREVADHVVCSM